MTASDKLTEIGATGGDRPVAAQARLSRNHAISGAAWAVLAAMAAVVLALQLAGMARLGVSALAIGRLRSVAIHALLWGAISLPLAGALLRCAGDGACATVVVNRARWALRLWNVGVGIGILLILGGGMSPVPPYGAPPLALVVMLMAAVLWVLAYWSAVSASNESWPVASWFGLSAALSLVLYLGMATVAAAWVTGPQQALIGIVSARAISTMWVAVIALGVAAALLPGSVGRPLYGRRPVTYGLWLWLLLQGLGAARDLAPDLVPPWLVRPSGSISILLAVPATLLAVGLLGAMVGRPTRLPGSAGARFVAAGVGAILAGAMAEAALLPDARRIVQFTAWDPATSLVPTFVGPLMISIGATYLLLGREDEREWLIAPRWHLWLALAAGVALVAPLWPLGLAEAAIGPNTRFVAIGAALRLPGAALALVSACVWLANVLTTWRWPAVVDAADRADASPQRQIGAPTSPRPASVVGTTLMVLVTALFATVFLPIVHPALVAPTGRAPARALAQGSLPDQGRDVYVADGCIHCHTQRVRAGPEDATLGPPTYGGDHVGGPALIGQRRAGPDLAWVADRHATRSDMISGISVHAADGALPMPWLFSREGPTDRGAALVDYLLRLRSTGGPAQ